eukprot:2624113-Karenia_brevis.AAC.1
MIQGIEGWVEKPVLNVERGVKDVGMLEPSKSSESGKAWYVGAVQCGVPHQKRNRTKIHNKFQELTREEDDEEEEFEECIEIPSLVSSDDEDEEKTEIP